MESFIVASFTLFLSVITLGYFSQKVVSLIGYRMTVVIGFPGVVMHEISHWLIAKMFGHTIIETKLFKPSMDGSLGYVNHCYKKSPINYVSLPMIAIAPLYVGPLLYCVVTSFLYPELEALINASSNSSRNFLSYLELTLDIASILLSKGSIAAFLWVFIGGSIFLFASPSRVDVQQCKLQLCSLYIVVCSMVHFNVLEEQIIGTLLVLSSLCVFPLSVVVCLCIVSFIFRIVVGLLRRSIYRLS